MPDDDPARIERVRAALRDAGHDGEVTVMHGSTHTADEAAAEAGCELGQIVKTLVLFVGAVPLLALVAGDRRLKDRLVADRFGVGRKQVRLASPDEVLSLTGYAVGGVTPFGLPSPLSVLVDESLNRFGTVWTAAGTPNAIFPIDLDRLVQYIGGEFAAIAT